MINLPNWIIIVFVLLLIIFILYKVNIHKKKLTYIEKILSNKTKTIINIIKYNSKKYNSNIALKIKNESQIWKEINYNQYYENILNFAQSTNYWLGSDIKIGIMGFNSPGWFYSYLGSMMNNCVSVCISTNYTMKECEFIINESNIELLVVENDEQLNKICNINLPNLKLIVYYSPITELIIKKFKIPIFSMGTFMANKTSEYKLPKINDIATIIYKTDKNKKLKGIILTHKNIMTSVYTILLSIINKSDLKLLQYENIISYSPLNNIFTQIIDIYIPIITISTVWFAHKNFLTTSIQKTLFEIKPTIFIGNSEDWEQIYNIIDKKINKKGLSEKLVKFFSPSKIIEKFGLNKCNLLININENEIKPLSKLSSDFFDSLGLTIYNNYSFTETSGPISISLPGLNISDSIGYNLMETKISKNNEILVKGDNLFKSYTNKKFNKLVFTNDNWFKTGIFGSLTNGFLFV